MSKIALQERKIEKCLSNCVDLMGEKVGVYLYDVENGNNVFQPRRPYIHMCVKNVRFDAISVRIDVSGRSREELYRSSEPKASLHRRCLVTKRVSEANETVTKPFRVGDEGDVLKMGLEISPPRSRVTNG